VILHPLHDAPVTLLALAELGFRPVRLGRVMSLDEDARHTSAIVRDGFVDEVEHELHRSSPWKLEVDGCAIRDVTLACPVDLIEQVVEPLADQLGKRLAHGLADELPFAEQAPIGGVGELEDVLGTVQDRDEARRLLEHATLPFGVRGTAPRGKHLLGDFGACAEQPFHQPAVTPDGRVGEGEVGLLLISVPVHHEGDVVHVDGHPAICLFHDRDQIRLDLRPYRQERPTQRMRMLVAKYDGISIVIEEGLRRSPSDEHGLVRAEKDRHKRLERRGPLCRNAERRLSPVVCTDCGAHLTTVGEEAKHLLFQWISSVRYHCSLLPATYVGSDVSRDSRSRPHAVAPQPECL
jgi:hypothetical protein